MHILHIYRLNIAVHHCETVSIKKKYTSIKIVEERRQG